MILCGSRNAILEALIKYKVFDNLVEIECKYEFKAVKSAKLYYAFIDDESYVILQYSHPLMLSKENAFYDMRQVAHFLKNEY